MGPTVSSIVGQTVDGEQYGAAAQSHHTDLALAERHRAYGFADEWPDDFQRAPAFVLG